MTDLGGNYGNFIFLFLNAEHANEDLLKNTSAGYNACRIVLGHPPWFIIFISYCHAGKLVMFFSWSCTSEATKFLMLMIGSYAIGGLAGGEEKDAFWRVVAQCTAGLPEDKPRYVMVSENKVPLLSATKVQTPSLPFCGFKLCYLPIILRCYLGKMFTWFNTKTTVAGAWHHSFLLPYVPGSGVPTRHCGLQCSRCRHVWLCLSDTDWSIWHCTGTRGMSTNTSAHFRIWPLGFL